MLCKIDNYLRILYRLSGYIAAVFLILVATFILTGIASRIFGFYIRGLAEYSGYSMAASSFLALAYTFGEKGHIRITLFLEKSKEMQELALLQRRYKIQSGWLRVPSQAFPLKKLGIMHNTRQTVCLQIVLKIPTLRLFHHFDRQFLVPAA